MAKAQATCRESDCGRRVFGHGLCNKHYQRGRLRDRRGRIAPSGEKTCGHCKVLKPFSQFAPHAGCRDGFRPECKDCTADYQRVKRKDYRGSKSRSYSLKKNFGLTVEQYEKMFAAQGGACKICRGENSSGRWDSKFLAVDHDHETGKVRGLLCNHCNSGLGMFKDSVKNMENAIKYLKRMEN